LNWIPWWISQTDADPDWKNRMPEYKPAQAPFLNRVHSGGSAAQYFTFHSTHTAGLLQVVDVPANAQVRFTIWGQAWSSASDADYSDFPTTVNMRIGIDPTGSTNPYSPAIVWSDYGQPYDTYQQFSVSAQAQGAKVTVFTISSPDEARKHNDIYWDDAELVATGGGAPPPPPAPTNAGGSSGGGNSGGGATIVAQAPAIGPTATPDADGIIYAEVQPGDSFWSIAARHGLTVDEIYELNNADENDFVQVGEMLIVGYGDPPQDAAEATAAAQATEEATAEPTKAPPTATPTPAVTSGDVCLLAYNDENQNGQRDAGEGLKSSVAFTIYDGEQVLVNYVTDGSSEPYCISLQRGNYRITRSNAPNEVLTTDREWAIAVAPGSEQEFAFGSYVDETALAEAGATTEAPASGDALTAEASASTDEGGVARWLVIAAVVVAVLLFVGVLVVILSARRSTV
jgi:LysM repeat protein